MFLFCYALVLFGDIFQSRVMDALNKHSAYVQV